MNILSGDISGLVFRRADRGDLGEFSLDSHMLSVLVELDGRRGLGSVAKKAGLDLREGVSRYLAGTFSIILMSNCLYPWGQ